MVHSVSLVTTLQSRPRESNDRLKMARKSIVFRGRREDVIDTFHVCGRKYFALEKLSRRGSYRVFDPHAAPGGDYRALHRISSAKWSRQRIETLRRITGPTVNRNFPRIVDCARSGDEIFVAIEWVWGTNLRDYLCAIRKKKIPRPVAPEIIRLIRGLAHGLAHYHRRANLVHGDISPANIILTSGTKQLVLIDFGSAWPAERTAEKENGDGITNPYAAPERIFGNAAEDFRSDIFSLCVVAYELLTLEIPYDGMGGQAGNPKLRDQLHPTLSKPSTRLHRSRRLPAACTNPLNLYFKRGLAIRPDGRFATRDIWLHATDGLSESSKSPQTLQISLNCLRSLLPKRFQG